MKGMEVEDSWVGLLHFALVQFEVSCWQSPLETRNSNSSDHDHSRTTQREAKARKSTRIVQLVSFGMAYVAHAYTTPFSLQLLVDKLQAKTP